MKKLFVFAVVAMGVGIMIAANRRTTYTSALGAPNLNAPEVAQRRYYDSLPDDEAAQWLTARNEERRAADLPVLSFA